MPQTIDQIIASRKSLYDPQRALIAQQQAALPGQEAADVAGLETAKTNAFGDITRSANARGMLYSGAPIEESNRYVGEKYLPALAGVKTKYAGDRSRLEAALLGINQDETTSAQQLQTDQQRAEADAAAKAESTALARQRLAISVSKANSRQPSKQESQAQFNGLLTSAFDGYNPKDKKQNFYTERSVIPYLVAQTGLPADEVAKQVYAYRMAKFGE